MANGFYGAVGLIGGTAGMLDYLDGDLLSDGDGALVITATGSYHYILDDDSAASESSPLVISPDDNAGTKRWILTPTYAEDIISNGPEIDVRIYGATGNGVTDDTADIQAAINMVNATGGGTVVFPAGRYVVSALQIRTSVSLVGRQGAVIVQEASATQVLVASNVSNFKITNLAVEGIGGVAGATYEKNGIYLDYCSDFQVTECHMSGLINAGMRLVNCVDFTVANNLIDDMTAGAGSDISITNYAAGYAGGRTSERFTVENNRCLSTSATGIYLGGAVTDFSVVGNVCSGHDRHGICQYQPQIEITGTISGNICASNGWTGIYTNGQGASPLCHVTISSNAVRDCGGVEATNRHFNAGISLYDVQGALVSGNTINNLPRSGEDDTVGTCGIILFDTGKNVVIANNAIDTVSGDGILLERSCADSIVVGNSVLNATMNGICIGQNAYAADGISVNDNQVTGSGRSGIFFWGNTTNHFVNMRASGNHSFLNEFHGLRAAYVDGLHIEDNYVYDNSQDDPVAGAYDGAYLLNCTDVSTIGNTAFNTGAQGQRNGIFHAGTTLLMERANNLYNNRGTAGVDGDTFGVDGTINGNITIWDGPGGNTPGYAAGGSSNGTLQYLFPDDNGGWRTHTSAPTANTDGKGLLSAEDIICVNNEIMCVNNEIVTI